MPWYYYNRNFLSLHLKNAVLQTNFLIILFLPLHSFLLFNFGSDSSTAESILNLPEPHFSFICAVGQPFVSTTFSGQREVKDEPFTVMITASFSSLHYLEISLLWFLKSADGLIIFCRKKIATLQTFMLPLHQSVALKRANQSSPNLRLD